MGKELHGTAPIGATEATTMARRGAQPSEVVVPEVATESRAAPLPLRYPRPQFVFGWHPRRWMIHAGELVPDLLRIDLQPGVRGVGRTRDGRITFAMAKAKLEERGYSMIPHSLGPDGSYMRRTLVDPHGQGRARLAHYHTPWETYFAGSANVDSDSRGYAAWLLSLVLAGHVTPCPPHEAEKLLEKARGRLERYEERLSKGQDSVAPAANAARAEIAVLETEIEDMDHAPVASVGGVELDAALSDVAAPAPAAAPPARRRRPPAIVAADKAAKAARKTLRTVQKSGDADAIAVAELAAEEAAAAFAELQAAP